MGVFKAIMPQDPTLPIDISSSSESEDEVCSLTTRSNAHATNSDHCRDGALKKAQVRQG